MKYKYGNYVYAMIALNGDIKVGKSVFVSYRKRQLEIKHGEPLKIAFTHKCDSRNVGRIEAQAHLYLSRYRVERERGREWYKADMSVVKSAIIKAGAVVRRIEIDALYAAYPRMMELSKELRPRRGATNAQYLISASFGARVSVSPA